MVCTEIRRCGSAEERVRKDKESRRPAEQSFSGSYPIIKERASVCPPSARTKTCEKPSCYGWKKAKGHGKWQPLCDPTPQLQGLGHGYRMTASDLFIFMRNMRGKKKKRNPAWVGWENTKIYVSTGFMRGKVDQIWGQPNGLSPSL